MNESLNEIIKQIESPANFSQDQVPQKGKLCLNMIVKNESRIIERLLESTLSIIDTYCICDTGSTDDTVRIIEEYMKKAGKPGIVFKEPFKNFGYNRTIALERAAEWGEYALLLDADMKLNILPEFDKNALKENGYSIMQKNGIIEYMNARIIKTGVGVRCLSPTHEYYDFPNGGGHVHLKTLWINDIGDGGAKTDKFTRDAKLLLEGIAEEPKNGRYHFYLANTYKNLGKFQEAIEYYKKRIELGGWIEEIFYSCFELGNCYKELKDMPNAIFWWIEGYDRHPKRTESLYEVVRYYRDIGKQRIAQILCDVGLKTPYPQGDVLFIRRDVYETLFHYENSILMYYSKNKVDHYKYLELIGKNYSKDNVISNFKFYVKKLSTLGGVDIDFCEKAEKSIGGRMDSFVSSSPCIIPHSDGYLLNIRHVNYTINPNGSYAFKHSDGKITTLQHVHWLNKRFEIIKSHWFDQVQNTSLRYQGIEDVKIFSHFGNLLLLGTVENPNNGNVCIGHGSYDMSKDCLYSTPFASPNGNRCEKNWCYFHNIKGELKVVYGWKPLTIGDIKDGELQITLKHESVPDFFRDLRGSSNGFLIDNEIWFLCHLVEYSTPRHYYHILVILDAETMEYKKHSIMFKFHSECIEYALGLIVEPSRLIFSYSRMDRTSAVMTIDRAIVDKELFPTN